MLGKAAYYVLLTLILKLFKLYLIEIRVENTGKLH